MPLNLASFCLQKIEEHARTIVFNSEDLFEKNVGSSHNACLVGHFAYLFFTSLQEWIADSRATMHMTKHQHLLSNYQLQRIGVSSYW